MTSIIHEYPNFEDRITFNFELGPLDFESVEGIIKHRLVEKGGGEREYFSIDAIRAIHNQTQGYPRKINKHTCTHSGYRKPCKKSYSFTVVVWIYSIDQKTGH